MSSVRMPEAFVIANMIQNVITRLKRAREDGDITPEAAEAVTELLRTALIGARKHLPITPPPEPAPVSTVEIAPATPPEPPVYPWGLTYVP